MSSYNIYPLKPDDEIQLRIRKRIPFDRLISLLLEGHEVFMECDRRIAYYIKHKLEEKIGTSVEVYPSMYKGMKGYMFKVSLVDQVLKEKTREKLT
jgi:hypothetical protein